MEKLILVMTLSCHRVLLDGEHRKNVVKLYLLYHFYRIYFVKLVIFEVKEAKSYIATITNMSA